MNMKAKTILKLFQTFLRVESEEVYQIINHKIKFTIGGKKNER